MKTLIALLLLSPLLAWGQTSNVTATITDPDGQTWNNGTFVATFVPTPGVPGPYTWNGGQAFTKQFNGVMGGTGQVVVSLPSNNFIAPAGSQWQFTLCSNTSAPCQNVTVPVTGGAPNLSSALSLPLIAPRFQAGQFSFGYLDVEVTGPNGAALLPGVQYWNVTTAVTRQWTGSVWQNLSGGGGGGGGTPANPLTSFQFNNLGSFGGTSALNGTTTATYTVATGVSAFPNIANVRWATPSYNWLQTDSAGSIGNLAAAGAGKVLTLTPCPLGFDPTINVNFPYAIYIAGTGTPEVATLTAATGTAGAASCTGTVTTLNNHAAGFTVGSASSGLQETIYDACRQPDYSLTVGGNCVVNLQPGLSLTTPNYTVRTRVWVLGRNVFNLTLHGNNAFLSCASRDACLTLGHLAGTGAHGTIDEVMLANSVNLDGVQIADVTAAAGTYTIHTASAHPFSMTANSGGPDYVYVNFYVGTGINQTIRGVFKVTSVADNTHFTFVNGATTFSNATGFGTAALENAAIENNMDGSTVSNVRPQTPAGSFPFNFFVIDDNDQHFTVNKLTNTPYGVRCTANFCGALVYSRGDSGNAGIVYLTNSELSLQCSGNGVIAASGNGFVLDNSVVQGYSQFGILDINGLVTSSFKDVYQESTGACSNPQAPAAAQNNQGGLMVQGQYVKISGNFPLNGTYPTFVTGGGGSSQINYFVVFHSTTLGVSPPLPVGLAQPINGGVTIPVSFPYVAMGASGSSQGTVTYDLLATTGTLTTPLTGTANFAVATAQSCTPTNNGWCTFSDTQAARNAYTVAAGGWRPPLFYWPGPLSLFDATAQMDSAFIGINSTRGNQVSVVALQCAAVANNTGALIMPTLYSCLAADQVGNGGGVATYLEQADASNNTLANRKGRLNLGPTGNMLGGTSTHLITLIDSNVQATAAASGNRPANAVNDAAIGTDCASGTNCITLVSPVSISQYIGNTGDGTNWKERLTSTLESFKVPITTNSQITSTLATGTAPFVVSSTTRCVNCNVGQLEEKTWEAPGTIGSTTPSTGAFTSVSATGTITGSSFISTSGAWTAGTIAAVGDVLCPSATTTASDCSHTGPNNAIIGIALGVAGTIYPQTSGYATLNYDAAVSPSAGWYACVSTVTDGKVLVQAAVCPANQRQVGIVAQSGIVVTSGIVWVTPFGGNVTTVTGLVSYDRTWSHTTGGANVGTSVTLSQPDLVANAEWVMEANVGVADAGGTSPVLATQFTLGGANVTGCFMSSTGALNNGATIKHHYSIRIKVLTTGAGGTAKVQCNGVQLGGASSSTVIGASNTTDATTTINTTGAVALTWTCSDSNGAATCHYYDSYTTKLN